MAIGSMRTTQSIFHYKTLTFNSDRIFLPRQLSLEKPPKKCMRNLNFMKMMIDKEKPKINCEQSLKIRPSTSMDCKIERRPLSKRAADTFREKTNSPFQRKFQSLKKNEEYPNSFPQRKAKKTNDPKWKKYYHFVLLTTNRGCSHQCGNQPRHSRNQPRHSRQQQRSAGEAQIKVAITIPQYKSERFAQNLPDISPWYINSFEQQNAEEDKL